MAYESLLLDHPDLLSPLARAEDGLARLDERIGRSDRGDGFLLRRDFADAVAACWLEGELVHMEDLVLHDGRLDVRSPSHELTRAHMVLRKRRRIAAEPPDWATGPAGLAALQAREESLAAPLPERPAPPDAAAMPPDEDDRFAEELAEIDAVLARSNRLLAQKGRGGSHAAEAALWPLAPGEAQAQAGEAADFTGPGAASIDALIRDGDRDERGLLADWHARFSSIEASGLPPVLMAFHAWDAWQALQPLERQPWLGNLLVTAFLRKRGKTRHLFSLAAALREIPREQRMSRKASTRCHAFFDAISAGALAGMKEIDRLELAAAQFQRRLRGRRKSSRLPKLAELILSRPIVSAGMIADELKITQRAALNLIGELAPRELTGRGRYRAWAVL
ncbi:RHE_PE00001 family protein [Nitratireductor luteus]|uniref:RHE_PE00001 family protein n=1 Tax=Nitratireductor luteus TaxID=2976980 RepID=UPI00223FECD0|nr:RHE_PE00001 family protein [Nitratireductor luteus]